MLYTVRLFISVALWVAVVLLTASNCFSAGTPAGTSIANQAHATYRANNGEPMPPVSSNVVSVIVQQLAAINITPPTATRTTQVNSSIDFPSTITNSGNGTDVILLAASTSLGFQTGIYRDANGNGVLDPGEISAGTISQTTSLAADSSMKAIIRVTVPNNITLNGQTDLLGFVGTSAFESTTKDTASYTTIISSASISFTKNVSNTLARGGDRVTYTLAYANPGSADATNVSVTDVLDNHLRYVTSSSVPPPISVTGQTIVWNLGTVAAGSNGAITFNVDVVNNAPPGTEIHNIAQMQYNDGPNVINLASTETNFITVQSGGIVSVDFSPNRTGSGEPGDTIDYAMTATNNGLLPEAFTLSASSNQNLPWVYYYDANGNGRIDSAEATTSATGMLASGGQYNVVARAILPVVPADGTIDVASFRAASTTNAGNVATATGTTTLRIPVMTLSKLADAPDPKPGRVIRYQITYANVGGGRAVQFAVTDAVPVNTSYMLQSVVHNGTPKTDEADGDEVTVSNNVVAVDVGSVSAGSSGVIEFRVRIN
ncbi:MAG: DUF11 domain-containing protein [Ignavibacteriae bacterium]|nr:DUF11 domain-containing protein [Ignavibacteriota bacterium]